MVWSSSGRRKRKSNRSSRRRLIRCMSIYASLHRARCAADLATIHSLRSRQRSSPHSRRSRYSSRRFLPMAAPSKKRMRRPQKNGMHPHARTCSRNSPQQSAACLIKSSPISSANSKIPTRKRWHRQRSWMQRKRKNFCRWRLMTLILMDGQSSLTMLPSALRRLQRQAHMKDCGASRHRPTGSRIWLMPTHRSGRVPVPQNLSVKSGMARSS